MIIINLSFLNLCNEKHNRIFLILNHMNFSSSFFFLCNIEKSGIAACGSGMGMIMVLNKSIE